MQLVFDTESDGFVDDLTRLHSLVIRDAETSEVVLSCTDDSADFAPIEEGLRLLADADAIIGHNIVLHDLPAIRKVYPGWTTRAKVIDTLVLSRIAWPNDRLRDRDFALQKKGKLPAQMIGRHAIEAWGYRVGVQKTGTDIADWSRWTPYMHERCESDCAVNVKVWHDLREQKVPEDALQVEQQMAVILDRQERRGFLFDQEAGQELHRVLMRRHAELEDQLRNAFPPWEVRTPFTPKANNKKLGYVKGVPTEKVKVVVFNPASRDHIADRLIKVRGWKPKEFTPTGKPQVDESTIGILNYPEAKLLTEYLLVGKRLGQLMDGKEALFKHIGPDGRIHGRVNPNGTFTFRMSHSKPNMSQVPSVKKPYGKEFRALLMAGAGLVLVGADADALELRCLAHYMAKYDGGAYIKTVLEGNKENGTDMHSVNARALGLDPVRKYPIDGAMISGREIAKVWFYAFIYGAGDWKLGFILGIRGNDAKIKSAGKTSRAKFLKGLPALGKLVEEIKKAWKKRGYLLAIDGRKLFVRSDHAALNAVLQSAGGIVMKHAAVILDERLMAQVPAWTIESEFVGNFHDEWQIETKETYAEIIGKEARASIAAAGEKLRFRCPLDGAYSVGRTWADTH
ncbi:MAG: DNA polymerase [Reyranella sp.]|uniref:DNA polymerase n=1 Tax=Reyranella sp. TaxID=1929291 RepID=UPI0011FE7C1D|nr:DNA polymerase [Reyranella sp.]TAJ97135.1 MAG: DNA polymerase [Reyranella sp.]TBR30223.1 MAG: DNA polymerase [Reyranella sp.]